VYNQIIAWGGNAPFNMLEWDNFIDHIANWSGTDLLITGPDEAGMQHSFAKICYWLAANQRIFTDPSRELFFPVIPAAQASEFEMLGAFPASGVDAAGNETGPFFADIDTNNMLLQDPTKTVTRRLLGPVEDNNVHANPDGQISYSEMVAHHTDAAYPAEGTAGGTLGTNRIEWDIWCFETILDFSSALMGCKSANAGNAPHGVPIVVKWTEDGWMLDADQFVNGYREIVTAMWHPWQAVWQRYIPAEHNKAYGMVINQGWYNAKHADALNAVGTNAVKKMLPDTGSKLSPGFFVDKPSVSSTATMMWPFVHVSGISSHSARTSKELTYSMRYSTQTGNPVITCGMNRVHSHPDRPDPVTAGGGSAAHHGYVHRGGIVIQPMDGILYHFKRVGVGDSGSGRDRWELDGSGIVYEKGRVLDYDFSYDTGCTGADQFYTNLLTVYEYNANLLEASNALVVENMGPMGSIRFTADANQDFGIDALDRFSFYTTCGAIVPAGKLVSVGGVRLKRLP
jgi:hypothetical protein